LILPDLPGIIQQKVKDYYVQDAGNVYNNMTMPAEIKALVGEENIKTFGELPFSDDYQ
jgi:hypothetical protein